MSNKERKEEWTLRRSAGYSWAVERWRNNVLYSRRYFKTKREAVIYRNKMLGIVPACNVQIAQEVREGLAPPTLLPCFHGEKCDYLSFGECMYPFQNKNGV